MQKQSIHLFAESVDSLVDKPSKHAPSYWLLSTIFTWPSAWQAVGKDKKNPTGARPVGLIHPYRKAGGDSWDYIRQAINRLLLIGDAW